MKNKFLTICLILVLTVTSLGLASSSLVPSGKDVVKSVQSLGMFGESKWTVHYRTPNTDQVETYLEEHAIAVRGTEGMTKAVQAFQTEWAKRNPTTPNPAKLKDLLDREAKGLPGPMSAKTATGAKAEIPQIMSLAVPVEFPASDTFDWCGAPVTTTGPLHNEIPAPGPRDNNTIWYDNATPALYNELYFGVGPKAGVIVHHPNLGIVDLRGSTMANYYLEQSEGAFVPKGEVYPKWLQAAHSEGWYGADGEDFTDPAACVASGNHNVRAQDLVKEVVDGINVDSPAFDWQAYDGDSNGIVDNFTVIHAGMGQEAGGGQQGDFSIWSHASAIDYPTGMLACTMGSAGCPDRSIYVREYSMDPEALDVGVIAEEFGHAAFGLPDIYQTDAQGSTSNWAIMEAGSWNGKIGGMTPAPFPLFFRYLVGWATPAVLDYKTSGQTIKVGQLSLRPKGTEQGIKINLPNTVIETPNPLGTGKAWWSEQGDLIEHTLARSLDLAGTTAPIFSFASSWSIEEDWDYGYVEVSEDNGATWTILPDMDGIFRNTNPNGNNQGWGLTGEGQGTLRVDLAAYAGKAITLRLRYSTDMAAQWLGWWADDFALTDGAATLWSDDVEGTLDTWTTDGWVIVPVSHSYAKYYLAEWRNLSGFDKGLATPYTTIYNDPATTEWEVDRCPYTVPGMLLYLRNAAYKFDYNLTDSLYDPPSYGPKFGILVVDSHYWPLEWAGLGTSEAPLRLNARCQPGNSTFTVQSTTPFTARRAVSTATGEIAETKTFAALPAVSQFHDALGYYPGLRYRPANDGLYFWDAVASVVMPTSGNYTTKITNLDKTPATDLYGIDLGDTILGSGDPRDNGVQFGVNIAVLGKASNGSWGQIVVWNAKSLGSLDMMVNRWTALPGQAVAFQVRIKNISPAKQSFSVSDPIPANTTFFKGKSYDKATNSIKWTGTLKPNQTKVLTFWVKVDAGTPFGTEITNEAVLMDDASGANGSVTTVVTK